MSGAPGLGQNPSPLESTPVSDLVNVCLDKLTIPLTYFISFNLLKMSNRLISMLPNW